VVVQFFCTHCQSAPLRTVEPAERRRSRRPDVVRRGAADATGFRRREAGGERRALRKPSSRLRARQRREPEHPKIQVAGAQIVVSVFGEGRAEDGELDSPLRELDRDAC